MASLSNIPSVMYLQGTPCQRGGVRGVTTIQTHTLAFLHAMEQSSGLQPTWEKRVLKVQTTLLELYSKSSRSTCIIDTAL